MLLAVAGPSCVYTEVKVTQSLTRLGRSMTMAEKRARCEAGMDGTRGPGADRLAEAIFGDD